MARSQARQANFFFLAIVLGRGVATCMSPSAIALFLPRIGVVVIAARLPEARTIERDEANARQPLRALPEIKIGDERTYRRAVRSSERLPFVLVRDEHVRRERLFDRHVRRVARRGFEDDVPRIRL